MSTCSLGTAIRGSPSLTGLTNALRIIIQVCAKQPDPLQFTSGCSGLERLLARPAVRGETGCLSTEAAHAVALDPGRARPASRGGVRCLALAGQTTPRGPRGLDHATPCAAAGGGLRRRGGYGRDPR